MIEIDRMALIIRPSEKMLAWIQNLANEEFKDLTLEDLYADCTVLLLPFFEDTDELLESMESNYLEVFAHELSAWSDDETTWPDNMTFKKFQEWFDLEVHTVVADIANEGSIYGYN